MKKTLTGFAGPSAEEKTMDKAKKEFLAVWIPWGVRLFNKAESYGIDWRVIPPEDLRDALKEIEAFAHPDYVEEE